MLPDTLTQGVSPEVEAEVAALMAVEPRVSFPDRPRAARITRGDVWQMRALVAGGVVAVGAFLWFLLFGAAPGEPWLYWPLVVAFTFAAILSLYEWFCYLGVRPKTDPPEARTAWTVDVLTTWCPGEPKDMVVATLKSILRISYPHTTYLCDEGDDPALREVCARLGIRHMTRVDKTGAKAGNINSALASATGDIAVIMDPDHEAAPYFLDRIVGFFDDPGVGFVQHVQAYYNQDESLIARGAAEQTYHFYGPLQTGMHGHGTTQAIGANCAFRRAALDSIGGHATGLAEDMATTLKIYAAGWTSVYSPEILTRGQVPGTFPAYCKQQLKWACGVWDILIESYPQAFAAISWKNRLHYVMNGLFYARGLFFAIGALIPIVALLTGFVPLEITLEQFLLWFGPFLAAQILIRQAAQRWLLERSETGLHLIGGFLMNSVWLIHLSGVVSALRRVRIPYIPTPKDDAATNAWSLALPNFVLVAASAGAVVYGLWWDWSPYSGVMAAFAVANIASLGTISVSAQQKLLANLRGAAGLLTIPGRLAVVASDGLCWGLRRHAAILAVAVAGLVGYSVWPDAGETPLEQMWAKMEGTTEKDAGGFMLGTYFRDLDRSAYGLRPRAEAIAQVDRLETDLGQDMAIASIFYTWNDTSPVEEFAATLAAIRDRGSVPMVTWMPTLKGFEAARSDPRYYNDERVFDLVLSGALDEFIDAYARVFRDHGGPVLLRFAHEMDNPQYPWSAAGGNTPEEFVAAWLYVMNRFRNQGATNVSWVWSPWNESTLRDYYPGDRYVDFIGLTVLNYGTSQGFGEWHSFDALYQPFRDRMRDYPAPVLIAEFGSTDLGGDRAAWLSSALDSIADRPEIAGTVLFNSNEDMNWPAEWDAAPEQFPLEWSMTSVSSALAQDVARLVAERPLMALGARAAPDPEAAAPQRINRGPEGWTMTVDGAPFQIRGVAYGVGGDWRTGGVASRNLIEADFADIAAMGANTIRRYELGWQDTNILRAADANGLKVMMGVWLDPSIDYETDTETLEKIEAETLAAVDRWKDHPAVLSWNVGNETWGQLKHRFLGPKLMRERRAYLAFVERLAQGIKAIDPVHPVMTSLEYSASAAGAITDVQRLAPSVDAIGVNVYYQPHLRQLEHWLERMPPEVPVFLSEFGPKGYWDPDVTDWTSDGGALEPTDTEKKHQYYLGWLNYADTSPHSIGGVAFTWRDRLEGSPTWFGLVDEEGRKKPAYWMFYWAWRGIEPPASGLPTEMRLTTPDSAAPGDRIEARLTGRDWAPGCTLEWQLVDEMTFETERRWAGADCGNGSETLALPDRAGRYRLIARVFRGEAVTTASHPIHVEE